MLSVNTIYPAFMGEVNKYGIGAPCTFVRLAGCNLNCYFKTKGVHCDTPEALSPVGAKMIYNREIVEEVMKYGNKLVCLTGGEPLLQDVRPLVQFLGSRGVDVVIETNGSIAIDSFRLKNASFVVDYKSSSSGENAKMRAINYSIMGQGDFLKFVVDTEEDYEEALDFYKKYGWSPFGFAIGTFWGSKVSYQWLIERMQKDNFKAHLNMQTHKMACLYDKYKENSDFSKLIIPKNL